MISLNGERAMNPTPKPPDLNAETRDPLHPKKYSSFLLYDLDTLQIKLQRALRLLKV